MNRRLAIGQAFGATLAVLVAPLDRLFARPGLGFIGGINRLNGGKPVAGYTWTFGDSSTHELNTHSQWRTAGHFDLDKWKRKCDEFLAAKQSDPTWQEEIDRFMQSRA